MKIIATFTKRKKDGLEGYHLVKDGNRDYKVKFSQDKAGNYGYFQWNAPTEILGFTIDETEKICLEYLETAHFNV